MHEADDSEWTLLDRYAANEVTGDEAAQVERWLAGDVTRRALLAAIRARPTHDEWDVQRAWSAVQSRAQLSPAPPTAARHWTTAPALLRAAMVLVVLGGVAMLGRAFLQRDAVMAGADLLAAETARSESDTVRLDDGSLIILAAASRLEYPRTFSATSREVRLTGEALFRVSSDRSRPFIVRAGHAVIQVVGTEFVTRTPSGATRAGDVSVAVVEGAVAVRGASGDVIVRPGEVALVSADGTATVRATDLDSYLDWTEGRLVFDDAPLTDVLTELQRWYAVDFRADSELTARRVTARLRAGSLDETVAALALALGAGYRRNNDVITFTLP